MLRPVKLPSTVTGALFLSAMPGRFEPFGYSVMEIQEARIETVLCLTPLAEVRAKSPDYAREIEAGTVPWRQLMFPIEDFGAPSDSRIPAFVEAIREVAVRITKGEGALVHCAAGIGRTGTAATCVLRALGVGLDKAVGLVEDAGASAETPAQRRFVVRVGKALTGKAGVA